MVAHNGGMDLKVGAVVDHGKVMAVISMAELWRSCRLVQGPLKELL